MQGSVLLFLSLALSHSHSRTYTPKISTTLVLYGIDVHANSTQHTEYSIHQLHIFVVFQWEWAGKKEYSNNKIQHTQ